MDLTLTPRIKVIALAGILAAVAMVGGMQMLARQSSAPAATPLPPIRHVVHPVAPAPKPAVTAKVKDRAAAKSKGIAPKPAARAKAKPKPAVTTPATAPPVTVAAAPTTPTTTVAAEASVTPGLPAPLAAALKKFPVVVIAVYDPQSQVDAIAYAEAQAGAQEARVGFVPVNVLDDKVAAPVTALMPGGGLLPDPGVLVFQRPGNLVTQFDGFVDRDTVAQAAANANPNPTPTAGLAVAWSTRADAACTRFVGGLPKIGAGASDKQLLAWIARAQPAEQRLVAALEQIPAPTDPTQRAQVAKLVAAYKTDLALTTQAATIIRGSGRAGLSLGLLSKLTKNSNAIDAAAADLGASSCSLGD